MSESVFPSGSEEKSHQRLRADLILLTVSVIWGSAFVAQRVAAESASVFLFNGLRFLLGALILMPFAWRAGRRNSSQPRSNPWSTPAASKSALTGVLTAGLLITCGAALQQAGLRFTTAGNAGFITGLYVVIIPIIQALILRQAIRPAIWLAAVLATIGLFLLSTGGQFRINPGDLLELAGAAFWALHVIWIGRMVLLVPVLHLAIGQYLICGVLSTLFGLILEPGLVSNLSGAGWAIIYTGIFSVGLGYTLQAAGQRVAPPADAAIILSGEAVFAALFGWWLLNEQLSSIQLIGCGVMMAGILLAQAASFRKR
jgi:drug/metabolite transporter (DMT)-like permease